MRFSIKVDYLISKFYSVEASNKEEAWENLDLDEHLGELGEITDYTITEDN